ASIKAHAPVVYPLIQCTDCGDTVSFGCLVTDYFPQPVTVTWISNVKGDNETFPVIQSSNSYYSLSTQLTVPASSLEGNNFQCRVDHSSTTTTVTETINGEKGDDLCCNSPPVIKLLGDPNQNDPQNRVLLMCLIEGPKASSSKVQWLMNQEVMEVQQEDYTCDNCSPKKATFTSKVNVSRQSWDLGAEFSCRVTHPSLKPPAVFNISSFCLGEVEEAVTILPPSLEDLYLSQNASITCVATNLKSYEDVKFSWSRDQGSALDVTSGAAEKLENGLYRLTSTLKICADEWNSGEKFTCTVNIPEIQEPISRSIKKDIGRNVSVKAPSVYVFPPPAEELARQETATLTCLALGFRPRDILVTWTQEDRPVSPGSFSIFGPQKEGDTYTVYSKLSVPAADWQRGDSFACVVGHDGIPLHFVQKTMDKAIGKPTSVNVSVVLADADVTCY
uniref:Ig-like domain-containing protein n=1 Tax=Aquila chrysaetos chrysaetos TaxID=223781 RepID=A0A663F3R3_AQUCH